MAESGKSDRWNSLLETLGVAPSESKPAEALETSGEKPAATPLIEQPRAISMLRPEKSKPGAKAKPAKQAKPAPKTASYWSRIAGALGLDVPAAPEEPEAPPAAQPAAPEERVMAEAPTEEARPIRGREEEPEREERPSRGGRRDMPSRGFERGRREERPSRREESSRERRFGSEPSPRPTREEPFGEGLDETAGFGGREEPPRMREPDLPRQREVDESGSVLDYEAPMGPGMDLPLGEEIERQPMGDEESQEAGARRRRRRRRGRGRRGGPETPGAAAGERHEEDIEPAGEDADFDFEREDDLEMEADLAPEREPRERQGPRGRGRRSDEGERYPPGGLHREAERPREARGRRRDSRAERSESRPAGSYEEKPDYAARPARPAPSQMHDEPDEADLDLGIGQEDEQGGDVPTHRKIPTWEEAVNILIDANMSSRGNADRDRGRGRGRGRR